MALDKKGQLAFELDEELLGSVSGGVDGTIEIGGVVYEYEQCDWCGSNVIFTKKTPSVEVHKKNNCPQKSAHPNGI